MAEMGADKQEEDIWVGVIRNLNDVRTDVDKVRVLALDTERYIADLDARMGAVEHLVVAHIAAVAAASPGHLARMKAARKTIPSDSAYKEVRGEFKRLMGEIDAITAKVDG